LADAWFLHEYAFSIQTCKVYRARSPDFGSGTVGEVVSFMLHPSTHKTNKRQPKPIHNDNSVSVLRGHPLGERVLARQAELETEMEKLDEGSAEFIAIDTALATLQQYLGADMEHLSDVTAHDLNNWIERNKYIGLTIAAKAKRAH